MRASRIIRNAAETATKGKPAPMSSDHTLYHAHPTGFWKKFRDAVVVNPEISSGLPIPLLNRYPQPGSRPEKYATPATQASDPAFNPYHKRDTRRAYPQPSVITQNHLSALLLASPTLSSIEAPKTANETVPNSSSIAPSSDPSSASKSILASSVPSLSSVLEKLPKGTAFLADGIKTGSASLSASSLPPSPPQKAGGKWVPKAGEEIPHDPQAYWPMIGYK